MNATTKRRFTLSLSAVLCAAFALSGGYYFMANSSHAGDDSAQQQQAMDVDVVTIQPVSSRVWQDFPGRLAAVDRVEIRPRVSGEIIKVLFNDGQQVTAGDAMFVIDPRPFEARVASAHASLESASSRVSLSTVELARARKLVKDRVISKSRFDEASNTNQVAVADKKLAQAQLKQAKLDLEYAHVKAPVSGRTSRAEITKGNIVDALKAPLMATIVSNDKLYGEFDVDERTYIQMVRGTQNKEMPVELQLSGDDAVRYQGVVHSFDNQLDSRSGTIRARAIFDNKDGALVPGMYANIRLGSADTRSMLLLDDKVVGTDQDRKFVYVLGDDNIVKYRAVEPGRMFDNKREIISGLNAGERVVTSNLQKIRPDMPVNPVVLSDEKDSDAAL